MTIKEMEALCGISRTNIRFYETEGLIRPNRRENGYRDYSQEDARTLMKVKLLRTMDVPLEQVKAAAFGERRLKDVLEELDRDIDRKQAHQERTRQTLAKMQQADTEFDDLEPEGYLAMLAAGQPVEDAPPRLNLPWRRYWARGLDYSLCVLLAGGILEYFSRWKWAEVLLIPLLMLLLEPLLLNLFATTPGKAIFGIRVTDSDGGRLCYGAALERTWTVMWEGEALRLPVISWYFLYKSLRTAENDETLPWEWDSKLTFRDDKLWRYLVYAAAVGAMMALALWKGQ